MGHTLKSAWKKLTSLWYLSEAHRALTQSWLFVGGIRRVEGRRIMRWLSSRDGCQGADLRASIIITDDVMSDCFLFCFCHFLSSEWTSASCRVGFVTRSAERCEFIQKCFGGFFCCRPWIYFQHALAVLAFERRVEWNALPTERILVEPWYSAQGQVNDFGFSIFIYTRLWRRTSSGWRMTSRERPTSSRSWPGWWTWSSCSPRPSKNKARRRMLQMVGAWKGQFIGIQHWDAESIIPAVLFSILVLFYRLQRGLYVTLPSLFTCLFESFGLRVYSCPS